MKNCSVLGCKNYRNKKMTYNCVRFFRFPKNQSIAKQWLKACERPLININNSYVCAEHFTDQDWKLQDILLNVDLSKRRLKNDAIPTENLPGKMIPTERDKRIEQRKRKEIVEEAIAFYDSIQDSENKEFEKYKKRNKKEVTDSDKKVEIEILEDFSNDDQNVFLEESETFKTQIKKVEIEILDDFSNYDENVFIEEKTEAIETKNYDPLWFPESKKDSEIIRLRKEITQLKIEKEELLKRLQEAENATSLIKEMFSQRKGRIKKILIERIE